jgi:hypothetical protein
MSDAQLPGAWVPFETDRLRAKLDVIRQTQGPAAARRPWLVRHVLRGVVQTGWALDELLDPTWRDTPAPHALFVIGLQRSGTTLLHRLLAQGSPSAVALTMQEMLFPASSLQGLRSGIARVDAMVGSPLTAWLTRIQDRRFADFDPVHRVRLHEIEEDEGVLWSIHAGDTAINDSPLTAAHPDLVADCDLARWPLEAQQRVLGWYRACVLKAVRRAGRDNPWYIGKNPRFSQRIPALRRAFPDARFVWLVRPPQAAIASRMSMLQALWRLRFPDVEMTPHHAAWVLEDSVRTYLSAHQHLATVPDRHKLLVRYAALRDDPLATAGRVAAHLGLPWSAQQLPEDTRHALARNDRRVSPHRYDLDAFGLDSATLRQRLAPLYDDGTLVPEG